MKREYRFSLLELIAVISIIMLLTGMIFGVGHTYRRRARESRTKATIRKLEMALDNYYGGDWSDAGWIGEDWENVPPQELGDYESDLDAQEIGTDNSEPVVVDGWLNPIQIRKDGENHPGLDIRSRGPDGAFDTENDIENWGRDGQW